MNQPDLSDWALPPVTAVPVTDGLINQTWALMGADGPVAVLQRLNTAVFRPEVMWDLHAISARLREQGLIAPQLIPTVDGSLWAEREDGVFRVLTWVGERTLSRVTHPAQAREAGSLLGRFHAALADFDWTPRHVRAGVHDTPRHFAALASAQRQHEQHRLFGEVAALAAQITAQWQDLPPLLPLPKRIVHGDPKVSNVRFQGDEAVAWIDLDTLAWGRVDDELGDALRSWCNRAQEDQPASFDVDLAVAALSGYARTGALSEEEWAAIPAGVERISLELSARFATDALEEVRFGWDPRWGTRGAHNLARAQGQAALAAAVRKELPRLQAALRLARGA